MFVGCVSKQEHKRRVNCELYNCAQFWFKQLLHFVAESEAAALEVKQFSEVIEVSDVHATVKLSLMPNEFYFAII
jgi:hypothetical protein